MSDYKYTGGPVRFRPPVCHRCRLDHKRVRKAEEWEDKFSERNIANDQRTCTRCNATLVWWWFAFIPITAEEIARFLARCDRRKKLAAEGKSVAEQNATLQLEN